MTRASPVAPAPPPGPGARAGTSPHEGTAELEVGVLVTGGAPTDRVDEALRSLESDLRARFPEFDWRIIRERWAPRRASGPSQPSVLLTEAAERRDAAHWDFVLVLTDDDLAGHLRTSVFATLSRALDAAVISLAPLQASEEPVERQVSRVATLMGHGLAHIAGLPAHEAPDNLLYRPTRAEDLDAMSRLEPDQLERWRAHLEEIADQRLEETRQPPHPVRFVFRAAWINRVEIAEAILGARPWQLPYRLGRLTAAAVSALAIVMMTAEAWEVGLSLDPGRLCALALLTLAGTTVFVTLRQQLLPPRSIARSEQTVVTAVASYAIVFIGMVTAWLVLALLALGTSGLVFPAPVIASWTAIEDASAVTMALRLQMSAFVASLAATMGALGASFEEQHFFRHVVLVDEEV